MNIRYLLYKNSKLSAAALGAAALGVLFLAGCGKKDNTTNPKDYVLTVDFDPAGSGVADLDPYDYKNGDRVTVTAIPKNGKYTFVGWTGATADTANPVTVTMDRNKTLTAKFSEKFALITAADPIEGGIIGRAQIDRASDTAYYAPNSHVALSALVNPGYKFLGWEGDTTLAADKALFTCIVTRDVTFTAKFQQMPRVLIGTTDGGSVTIDPKRDYYEKDEKVILTAAAKEGYVFVRWLDSKGVSLNSSNPYTITIDDTDAKLTAEFGPSPQ